MRGRVALVVAALALAALPLPASFVERWYSSRLYAVLQPLITSASNRIPFAVFDVALVVVIGGWLLFLAADLVRGARLGWTRVAVRGVARTAVWASVIYLLFALTWGLNYRRVPLAAKLRFDAARVSPEAARVLALTAIDRLNTLHHAAHARGWAADGTIDAGLASGFSRAQHDLGTVHRVEPARPKATLLDLYFRRAGVDGMTDPFFLETLIAQDILPFERPFVVAHEWGHLAGFADEGEANFVGWLACLRGAPPDQYSGWLFLYGEVMRTVRAPERADVIARLAPGPRADLRAIAARIQRQVHPRVAAAGWRVYDRYLKANRVEAGAASYAEVVRLVLGIEFGPDWTPSRK